MTMSVARNQESRVLDYMATRGGITQVEALRDIGVMRLASRVSALRKKGWPILDTWEAGRNRYGEKYRAKRYYLENGEGKDDEERQTGES